MSEEKQVQSQWYSCYNSHHWRAKDSETCPYCHQLPIDIKTVRTYSNVQIELEEMVQAMQNELVRQQNITSSLTRQLEEAKKALIETQALYRIHLDKANHDNYKSQYEEAMESYKDFQDAFYALDEAIRQFLKITGRKGGASIWAARTDHPRKVALAKALVDIYEKLQWDDE